MTFEKMIKILITKLGDARRMGSSKPFAYALYETYIIVDAKESARNGKSN